jgi:hypothetical protein
MSISKSKLVFLSLLFFYTSCVEDVDISPDNPKIKSELERKKSEFISEMMSICRAEAIKRAEIYVDSMVAADFFMELSGTLPFPDKPIKPTFEGPIIIKDTIQPYPILK